MAIYIVSVGASKLLESFMDCFIADTLVLTSTGLIKIENIKTGDKVWSYDEKTKKKSSKAVAQIFRNKTKEWVHLFVKNTKTNGVEEIVRTPNHRIYIKNKGWIKAVEILDNDKVLLYNNIEAYFIDKTIQILEDYETIYNFKVEELQNYFVETEKVLVHNDIRFTQDSISSRFNENYSVEDMISDLRSGIRTLDDVEPIRVFQQNGKVYSLDNRRLYAFKKAEMKKIRAIWVDPKNPEIAKLIASHFTTVTDDLSIMIR